MILYKKYIHSYHLKNSLDKFTWSDEWQYSYTNWGTGWNSTQEGQRSFCGILNERKSFWNTTSCSNENDFICKISKVRLIS